MNELTTQFGSARLTKNTLKAARQVAENGPPPFPSVAPFPPPRENSLLPTPHTRSDACHAVAYPVTVMLGGGWG